MNQLITYAIQRNIIAIDLHKYNELLSIIKNAQMIHFKFLKNIKYQNGDYENKLKWIK